MLCASRILRGLIGLSIPSILLLSACGESKKFNGTWTMRNVQHTQLETDSAALADCHTEVVEVTFQKDGVGTMVDQRGALYDLTWSVEEDDLAVRVAELQREQSLTIEWEDENTFVINNCKCTYEFTRQ